MAGGVYCKRMQQIPGVKMELLRQCNILPVKPCFVTLLVKFQGS